MELGERLYRLRKERNLSQGELADALGVSRQSISKWENNTSTPELDKLVKLGELFGLSLDELVKGQDSKSGAAAKAPAPPLPVRRYVIGGVLLACGLLLCFAVLLLAQTLSLWGLWLVLAGIICLTVRRRPALAAAWAALAVFLLWERLYVGNTPGAAFRFYLYPDYSLVSILLLWLPWAGLAALAVCTWHAASPPAERGRHLCLSAGLWLLLYVLSANLFDLYRPLYWYPLDWSARHLLFPAALLSLIPLLRWSWLRFPYAVLLGYVAGNLSGAALGGLWARPPEYTHYGFLFAAAGCLLGAAAGALLERRRTHKKPVPTWK